MGGWLNRSRRPHSFGKQGSGNLSNGGEHVLGPWIGKQQAGPYVSLCHKDTLAYLAWQTGLPKTINLACFIKIKQWPLTSPLSVQQMPRSISIGLKRSLFSSIKRPRPESGWQRLAAMVAVGPVCRQQAESVFSSTVQKKQPQILRAEDERRNTSILLLLLLSGARDFVVRPLCVEVGHWLMILLKEGMSMAED